MTKGIKRDHKNGVDEANLEASEPVMNPVAKNLKRAYREAEPQDMPPEMADLLRKLQEQDKQSAG
ncbi:hypothetical protein ACEWPM_018630 [Roseovarius sp. S4756]|uniref:hypothetical protein n=1 Tax=Roseovarius maritimus TaxID=3342637 RepID=UPI00372BAD0E